MYGRCSILLILCGLFQSLPARSQCNNPVNIFPYREDFETTNGNWVSGGAGNNWAWGTPAKSVITTAGGGARCWVVGGLTGSSYSDGEASWLQSPCFDFSNLQYPYMEFRLYWETEQQFDGAGLQYSTDNGTTWQTAGSVNDPRNCFNQNWFNLASVTYLAPLGASREGWSGTIRPTAGSCRGGNGSNGWVVARHTFPQLAGRSSVIFRFVFGAGTICNNYDGFGVDDIQIREADPNVAGFTYQCVSRDSVRFTNTSALCPTAWSWDFGDPGSGTANNSTLANPAHRFSGPGTYTVRLTVSGPDNAPSTITRQLTILQVAVNQLDPVSCNANTGGRLEALVSPAGVPGLQYSWNTQPVQAGPQAVQLGEGNYTVSVSGTDACPASASALALRDLSCQGIYFPSAITPNNDGRNDGFGPLGSVLLLTEYRLRIYNRWGQVVFESRDPGARWRGLVQGQDTDSHLFIWQAEFTLPGREREYRKGTLMVIR